MVYRFYHIPGVTPRDIINKKLSDMPGFFRQITEAAEARGTEITVDFADGTNPNARTLGTTTHICTTPNSENTGIWSTWYRVTSVIEIAPATSTQGRTWRLTATLAALQTVVTNSLETRVVEGSTFRLINAQRWELNRAGVPDPSQTSEPCWSDCHSYRYQLVERSLLEGDWVAVVTGYSALVTESAFQMWIWGSYKASDPHCFIPCDSNGALVTGVSSLGQVGVLATDTATKGMIYRVQIVPKSWVDGHITGPIFTARNATAMPLRMIASGDTSTNIITPDLTAFRRSDLAYRKSYGTPVLTYEYAGTVLGRFNILSNADASALVSPVNALVGFNCVMGFNAYIKFSQNAREVGFAAIPVPEIMGSSDGLQEWYQTTGQNLVANTWQNIGSTVAMTGTSMAVGAAAGGPIGAAIGMGVGALSSVVSTAMSAQRAYEIGEQQAKQTLITVGGGPSNIFANGNHHKLKVFIEKFNTTDESKNDMYFRRHGYSCVLTRDNLTTLDRENFESFAGSGTFSIWADQAPDVTVDYNDLHDRANAELSGGVTVWSTSSIGDYTVSNDPV